MTWRPGRVEEITAPATLFAQGYGGRRLLGGSLRGITNRKRPGWGGPSSVSKGDRTVGRRRPQLNMFRGSGVTDNSQVPSGRIIQYKTPHQGLFILDDGGAEGNRTPDLHVANVALSQLSYGPEPGVSIIISSCLKWRAGNAADNVSGDPRCQEGVKKLRLVSHGSHQSPAGLARPRHRD